MMRRFRSGAVLVCVAACAGLAQTADERQTAAELAERGGEIARDGRATEALRYYRLALAKDPDDTTIRADYATVLGWAEKYSEAIAEFRAVFAQDTNPPEWMLQEFARAQLFGNQTAGALDTLNKLIQDGDSSEATLCRKGLALRWLGRPKEAEETYRGAVHAYPDSTMAEMGMIYSVADQNRLESALRMTDDALRRDSGNWRLRLVKGQILNWLGRHHDAARVLGPIDAAADRELLETRIAAARWGGRPGEAKRTALALAAAHPEVPAVMQLKRDVSLEYGRQLSTSYRFSSDSDGLTDQLYEESFAVHAGPANRVQLNIEQRRLSLDRPLGWRRSSLAWSSQISSRLSSYTSLSQVAYRGGSDSRAFVGDGSLTYAVSDRVRISGGGGSAAMDAYRAIENQVQSHFVYGEISLQPTSLTSVSAKYYHAGHSDGIARNKVDLEGFRRIHAARMLRLDLGGGGNWMMHNRETGDFFSPRSFHSIMAKVRFSGRLSRRIEYTGQAAAGMQREYGYDVQSPFQLAGSVFARISSHWLVQIDGGTSTSSLERINAGRASYSRHVLAASLLYRFE